MAEAATKNRAWAPQHVSIGGAIFAVSVLVAMLISTFYWKAMGLMP